MSMVMVMKERMRVRGMILGVRTTEGLDGEDEEEKE